MPAGPFLKKMQRSRGAWWRGVLQLRVFVDILLRKWHEYEALSIYKCAVTHDPLVPGLHARFAPPGCNERPPMCECLNPLAGEGRGLSRSQRGVIGWRTCGTGE